MYNQIWKCNGSTVCIQWFVFFFLAALFDFKKLQVKIRLFSNEKTIFYKDLDFDRSVWKAADTEAYDPILTNCSEIAALAWTVIMYAKLRRGIFSNKNV